MKCPMLTQRGLVWYSRINVPLDVQPALKRKEIWKSLRTSDAKEAQVLALGGTSCCGLKRAGGGGWRGRRQSRRAKQSSGYENVSARQCSDPTIFDQ